MLTDAQLEAIVDEIEEQVRTIVRERVDRDWSDGEKTDRYRVTAALGRSLVVVGITFLGPALGIRDGDAALGETYKFLDRLAEIAKLHRGQN